MKKIEGSPKNLKQLLQNTKYSIHYYQREYMWQTKQILELIEDLTSEFLNYYHAGDSRMAVQDYGTYFMGSIVLAGRENAIIDGQQRLSSLTLLLIFLNNRLKEIGQAYNMIDTMIFSESFRTKSFNINVNSRYECMNAIYNVLDFEPINAQESEKNLYNRYKDIVENFPDEITNDMLLHFCDWLAEKVYFIEIVATTEQDAHKVFVTMNDRGLSLTSTEMLKGYILSEITNDSVREHANAIWKDKVLALKSIDDKGDETFIKTWLRSQYAETIREPKAGAENKDFDIIGGSFHKWVREEREKLCLINASDYEEFINRFARFADIYIHIRKAENTFDPNLRYVYYNSKLGFTLQSQLLMAAISHTDSWEIINKKFNLVSQFIDYMIISRVTNYRSVDYSTIKNYVFNVTKSIRRLEIDALKKVLKNLCDELEFKPFEIIGSFGLNNFTKKYIKHILARIIGYIEEQTDVASNYCNYVNTDTRNPFEIEHIITDHFEWFTDDFADPEDFKRWRNNIGGLLLLHKSINASLNDSSYSYKLQKYCSNEGNIYSESLGETAYSNNPRFIKFVKDKNLSFTSYKTFGKKEISERGKLVAELISLIWNTASFC